jgi:deoxyadenosine/deoxycytidine kinase
MTTQEHRLVIRGAEIEQLTTEQAEYLRAFLKVYGAWFPDWQIQETSRTVDSEFPWEHI